MTQEIIYGILTCRRCGNSFKTAAPNAKYCSLTCQQAMARARRKERIATGEVAVAHYDTGDAAFVPTIPHVPKLDEAQTAEMLRMAREAQARHAGIELTEPEAPGTQQSVLEQLGYAAKYSPNEGKK